MAKPTTHKLSIHQKMVGDAVRIGLRYPYIHALVELDITDTRQHLRTFRKETGQQVSLSAYILHACAKAIVADPSIQSMPYTWNRVTTFEEADFFMPMENVSGNEPVLSHRLIRNVAAKSPIELTRIIESAIHGNITKPDTLQRIFLTLPWFIRKPIYALWMSSPSTRKKYFGTVYFSSIMNFSANRRTWGIPIPMHSLGIFIGTICDRFEKGSDGIEKREMLQITVSIDHRVNNGGDMARFVHRLKDILERQTLLNEF